MSLQETCLISQLMAVRFNTLALEGQIKVKHPNGGGGAKMSFLLCTIFLKSVLISRSPQLFVLRIGAVSFYLTSGGAKSDCSLRPGAQNQWDV
ncbi:hypothetical protein V5O39_14815 [Pseudomonas parakoreensis]